MASGKLSVSARAWFVVALLWLPGCINYLDRVMITTMRSSVLEKIPMTDAQYGLLTTVFLLIYAVLSPFAGFLADRIGRTRVIIGSVVAWSAVTWATGFATSFDQLLLTRALLAVSEVCYIPAAVALISDYHPGGSRSLANGINMSGIMAGSALGGLGGWLADSHGWNYAFLLFGQLGLGVAVVLMVFLRDLPPVQGTVANAIVPRIRLFDAFKSLLGRRDFLIVVVYWSCLGTAAWSILAWMPTYLKEHFQLGQGEAGMIGTVSLQSASFLGVIVGGFWADRWSRRSPRAPVYVVMVGLGMAVPSILLISSTSVLWLAVVGLVSFGLFKSFADTNMMPILTLICDARYRATAWGILSMCACTIGGLAIYAGGMLRDAHISVVRIFQFGAIGFVGSILLLMCLRTDRTAPAK
ncbi:MAG: MFS transporter [Opitutus sp.]